MFIFISFIKTTFMILVLFISLWAFTKFLLVVNWFNFFVLKVKFYLYLFLFGNIRKYSKFQLWVLPNGLQCSNFPYLCCFWTKLKRPLLDHAWRVRICFSNLLFYRSCGWAMLYSYSTIHCNVIRPNVCHYIIIP